MSRFAAAVTFALAASALAGASACTTTVEVYGYAARPLPAGVAPLDAINASLRDVRNVNWGMDDQFPSRRARFGADAMGLAAVVYYPVGSRVAPLYLSYGEIVHRLRAVTHEGASWKVHVSGHFGEDVEIEFGSRQSARLFLDGAAALARPTYARRDAR